MMRWVTFGWRLFLTCFLLSALVGCFPYRETYRRRISGVVVDSTGKPVRGALVESCSETRWHGFRDGCARRAVTKTDARGQFEFKALKEWEWCCLGEAPFPITLLLACSEGKHGMGAPAKNEVTERYEARLSLDKPNGLNAETFILWGVPKDFAVTECTYLADRASHPPGVDLSD